MSADIDGTEIRDGDVVHPVKATGRGVMAMVGLGNPVYQFWHVTGGHLECIGETVDMSFDSQPPETLRVVGRYKDWTYEKGLALL